MKGKRAVFFWIQVLLISLLSNSYIFLLTRKNLIPYLIFIFVLINILSGLFDLKTKTLRLKFCSHGAILLCVFVVSAVLSILYHVILAVIYLPEGNYRPLLFSILVCYCAEAVVFWNGIISVYLTSHQLGIKGRITGALGGMIPILNLFLLRKIIRITLREVQEESLRELRNAQRAPEQLCGTKYPLLFVHGVFFRDSRYFNYWGRIPKELEANGAVIYYGNHQSAASIADSAGELTQRIKDIIAATGCEKVNVIAHSKGGLDCRYALANLDAAPYIASLTTINTPHRGCIFADYLLNKIPAQVKDGVADRYNKALKKLGDINPDFLAAVNDLTASHCTQLDQEMPVPEGIYCRSIGSVVKKASGGSFPLNLSYHLVKYFDGSNDGLVSDQSFAWSENYRLLTPEGD